MGKSRNDTVLKILILQHRFPPAIGGSERHTCLLSGELARRGHDVVVYTTNSLTNGDVLSLPLFKREEKKPNLPRKEKLRNIRIARFDIAFRYWSFNWIPEMFRELKKNAHEFDIIHAHGYHLLSSVMGCYYAKKNRKLFILTAHDLIIPNNSSVHVKLLKKVYDETLGRYLLKNSTKMIALTEDHIQQYAERGGDIDKIRTIPNGIDLDKYRNTKIDRGMLAKYEIDDGDKVLLFVGRIEIYKGIQDVIEILPKISKKYPNVKFIVVGVDYGYQSELENLGRKLNVDDRVKFTGEVPEEDLIGLHKRADLFVFPSRMEGFGIVLLEAMASGTLCIAYSIQGVRKVVKNKENGVLVEDKSELSASILHYLERSGEKMAIEKNALEFVKSYDINNIAKLVEETYRGATN